MDTISPVADGHHSSSNRQSQEMIEEILSSDIHTHTYSKGWWPSTSSSSETLSGESLNLAVCSFSHGTFFFSPAEHNRNSRFMNHGQTDCCVIFLDTSTFSSDCYLGIFKLANSPMHIFEKDFYYHSKCIMIVICPAIQHWFLTNIFFFFYYINGHYVLSSLFLICFYSPLFILNLLFSFQGINSTSDTIHFCYDFFWLWHP